jgi:hypothetical protein
MRNSILHPAAITVRVCRMCRVWSLRVGVGVGVFFLAGLAGCSKQGSSANPPAASTSSSAATGSGSAPAAASPSSSGASGASAASTTTTLEEQAPRADPVAPPGPVTPKLTLDASAMGPGQWRVVVFGLPAVSSDGKLVGYVADKTDGMRGYANQVLVVKAVDGEKVEKEIKLLDASEINKAESAPNASGTTLPAIKKKTQGKLDDAAAYLAKSSWIALARPASAHALAAAGLGFELTDARLRAKNAAGKSVLDQDAKSWAAKGYTPGQGQGACKFEPRLSDVAADADHKVAFVRVDQSVAAGGDSCNADPIFHVYRLGGSEK